MWNPLGIQPVTATARWEPEPPRRGTFTIVSACTTTLILCLWSVLRLNIPEQGKATKQIWRKTKWLLLGLLAPELIALNALQQWSDHRRLTTAIRSQLGDLEPTKYENGLWHTWLTKCGVLGLITAPDSNQVSKMVCPCIISSLVMNSKQEADSVHDRKIRHRRHPWTPIHSYYALMGGFVFDNSTCPPTHVLYGLERRVIDKQLLLWLAEFEPDMIPDISADYIKDKSKADSLAKLLCCFQVSWFGLQATLRLASGSAITLLELNTFAHVVCAIVTYIIWWNKPLDIDEPTTIPTDESRAGAIFAAIYVPKAHRRPLMIQRPGSQEKTLVKTKEGLCCHVDRICLAFNINEKLTVSTQKDQPTRSFHESVNKVEMVRIIPTDLELSADRSAILVEVAGTTFNLELLRLGFCASAARENRFYVAFDQSDYNRHCFAYTHNQGAEIIRHSTHVYSIPQRAKNCSNFTWDDKYWSIQIKHLAASLLYSGWHLLAWNAPFRTEEERLMWKMCVIALAVPLLQFDTVIGDAVKEDGKINGAVSIWALPVWALCRTFLIAESLFNLAHVSDEAFIVPDWSVYIPHIC